MSEDKANDGKIMSEKDPKPASGRVDRPDENAGDNIVPEETAAGETAGAQSEEATAPEEPAETESERFLRLAADFDNYRKRTAREFSEIIRTANARLLKSLVAIADDFERALTSDAGRADLDAYRKGVELIYGQIQELLNRERVKPIDAVGKPFDPQYHDALMQQASEEYEAGIVSGVIQKGYLLDEQVLRHARVIVSSGRNADTTENSEQE